MHTHNSHEIASLADAFAQMPSVSPAEIVLPPRALARLQKLQLKSEGAALVARAAIDAANASQAEVQAALTALCQDAGMTIPNAANVPVDVDWDTGVVKLRDG